MVLGGRWAQWKLHAKSATNDTRKNGFGPSNAMVQFGTLLLCQIVPFQNSPVPKLSPPPGTPCPSTASLPALGLLQQLHGKRGKIRCSIATASPGARGGTSPALHDGLGDARLTACAQQQLQDTDAAPPPVLQLRVQLRFDGLEGDRRR